MIYRVILLTPFFMFANSGHYSFADPDFSIAYTWDRGDVGYVSSAEWVTKCGGDEYRASLNRTDYGANTYIVTRNGNKISDELNEFLSKNTSYFREYNWLESVSCHDSGDFVLSFFGISKLPQYEDRPDDQAYNAYRYNIMVVDGHVRSQYRQNLEPDIVSDLPKHLEDRGFDTSVPGGGVDLDYCRGGVPCAGLVDKDEAKSDRKDN